MKLAYILMEINGASPEPGATLSGHAVAYTETDATEDGPETMLPSGVVQNYKECFEAFERNFNDYSVEETPLLTMHVCFELHYARNNKSLCDHIAAVAKKV